jgi:hypothetical protein
MRKLTTPELEDLVRWFTYRMKAEQRRELMGDLPRHYKMLYPSVSNETIADAVAVRLETAEGWSGPLPNSSLNL